MRDAKHILETQELLVHKLYHKADPADRMAFHIGMLKELVRELCEDIKQLEEEIIYLGGKNGTV
jgi:hypothetical protein